MQIERAKPEDAATLTELAFIAKRHWGYSEQQIESWRDVLTLTPDFIASHETHAAVVGGRTVGFYALGRKGDGLDLLHMWVLPDAMGRGTGRALFLHALERVQALGFQKLEIESDPNAEGFYQRMGARRIGLSIHETGQQRRELPVLIYEITRAAVAGKIRRYQSDDYQRLLSFLDNALREMGYGFLPDGKDADVRDVDGVYLKERGSFYVIDDRGEIRGCVGLRRLSDEVAELKRLYIAREFRGQGLGRALCLRAIEDARTFDYQFLRLDTTAKSQAALALFGKLGFYEIARYNSNPLAELFMEKTL